MSRMKSKKRGLVSGNKSRAKAQNNKKISSSQNLKQKMKEFMQLPNTFASELSKEIAGLKQKAVKLKQTLNRTIALAKKSTQAVQAASKIKTAAGKKRLTAAKKQYKNTAQLQAMQKRDLQSNQKSLDTAVQAQAKLLDLSKYLQQFDKQWRKQAKKTRSQTKTIAVKSKRAKKQQNESASPFYKQYQTELDKTMGDNVQLEETSEATS